MGDCGFAHAHPCRHLIFFMSCHLHSVCDLLLLRAGGRLLGCNPSLLAPDHLDGVKGALMVLRYDLRQSMQSLVCGCRFFE